MRSDFHKAVLRRRSRLKMPIKYIAQKLSTSTSNVVAILRRHKGWNYAQFAMLEEIAKLVGLEWKYDTCITTKTSARILLDRQAAKADSIVMLAAGSSAMSGIHYGDDTKDALFLENVSHFRKVPLRDLWR